MTAAIVTAAVLAAAAIAVGIRLLHKAGRLERLIEAHNRDEADLEAMADATREDKACGCRWVPCDKHTDRLLRIIRKDGEPQ